MPLVPVPGFELGPSVVLMTLGYLACHFFFWSSYNIHINIHTHVYMYIYIY
jgi:hypothetical protein